MATTEYITDKVTGFLIKVTATGAAAIAASATAKRVCRLGSIAVKFSAAPTTSEDLTVTLNSMTGAAYDTVLLTVDPSTDSTTSIVYIPDAPLLLEPGDAVDVAYTNTDTVTYGVTITLDEVL